MLTKSKHEKNVRVRVRRVRETVVVCFAVGLALSAGAFGVLSFERVQNPDLSSFGKTFWYSLFSLMGNEPVGTMPVTTGGKVVSAAIVFTGLVAFEIGRASCRERV